MAFLVLSDKTVIFSEVRQLQNLWIDLLEILSHLIECVD